MVSITPTPLQAVTLPTVEEAEELLRLCCETYPVLARREGEDIHQRRHQFARSMFFCAYARRVAEPQTGFHFSFFLGEARAFLEQHGLIGGVTVGPFTAAVVCSGISFHPLTRFPFDLAYGLSRGEAVAPSEDWKDILAAGAIPKPVEPRGLYLERRRQNIDVQIIPHD